METRGNGLSIESLRSCLGKLLQPSPVVLAYLFGSAATGRMTPLSDVDIALVIDGNALPPSKRLQFELMLEDKIKEFFVICESTLVTSTTLLKLIAIHSWLIRSK
jgi:predicted nucleotidyltransferase